jgi:hypothetical protein
VACNIARLRQGAHLHVQHNLESAHHVAQAVTLMVAHWLHAHLRLNWNLTQNRRTQQAWVIRAGLLA